MHLRRLHSFTTAAAIALAATVSASAQTETHEIPGRWLYTPDQSQTLPPDDRWWTGFNDPILDSLIVEAVDNNYDIAIAASRIAAANAAVRSAQAAYYPTIGVNVGYNLLRSSGNTTNPTTSAINAHHMSLGATASWEIDLFGRISSTVKEQKARRDVSRADYEATMVSLCAQLASSYIDLRQYQVQLAVLNAHLKSQESVVNIARARHEADLVSGLDVSQAETVLFSTRAALPSVRSSIATTINAIAILLGRYPAEVEARLSQPKAVPIYKANIMASLPGELLRRRPDVVAAERSVAAQAAALGVAKKDFLPTLAIQGSFALESRRPGDLFEKNAISYSVAPTLTWTLFDGFGRRAAVAAARAQLEIETDTYRQTVLNAVSEVENAMISYRSATEYEARLKEVVESAANEVKLSLVQYRSGLALFTTVAQAQTTYLQYDDELVAARAARSRALVDLYRALGGGYLSDSAQ